MDLIRVLLADDHTVVRAGLRALVEKDGGIEVVAEADDGRQAVALALKMAPHVVLMDVSMPKLNGIEATRQITTARPDIKVLCLSMHVEEHFVGAALEAGARGYLLKDCHPDELVRAIRVVAGNQTYLAPAVARTVVEGFTAHRAANRRSSVLTDREREVLQLIAEGQETKDIARTLGVSVKTVASHRERIQQKLNVAGIAGLTRYAMSAGLVPPAERPFAD
jgi:DNA-binding NarL/FixJ family response regulator